MSAPSTQGAVRRAAGRAAPAAARAVDFVKVSPTQNMTVLVTSQHAVADYRSIATQLLSVGHLQGEQVGFIRDETLTGDSAYLHMAGGEFCGNACMALAALTAAKRGLGVGETIDVTLGATGTESLLTCRVDREGSSYRCELTMPLPVSIESYPFPGVEAGRSALVRYQDAVHLVVESEGCNNGLRERARDVAAQLAVTTRVPVVGVMVFDPARQELAPLVVVPSLDSTVWERSCGSGAASVGAYLTHRSGAPVRISIQQPGGTMQVWTDIADRDMTDLRISGQVYVVAEGTAYIHG